MSDAPIPAVLLAVAFLTCVLGLAWLALAMDAHWAQVRGEQPLASAQRRTLRVLGSLALAGSAALCLRADHAGMAALVWIMMLAAGVLAVAFTLAWRAHWLRPLVWMLKTRRFE